MVQRRVVDIGETQLEYEVFGSGAPVVVIQTALTADELRPLAELIARRGGLQVVHYHRRGYAGSGPTGGNRSVASEAADCRALIDTLGLAPVHVVSASFSAAIGLTLASATADRVRTLTVIEAPPVHVPSRDAFLAVSSGLLETYGHAGPATALDEVMTMLQGPQWRSESERDLPGSVTAMQRDATTFFESDLPALLAWQFGAEDAARISCPIQYCGGSDSGQWFAEVRSWVLDLLPQAEDAVVVGAGHLLASSHTKEVAAILTDFLHRHLSPPVPGRTTS